MDKQETLQKQYIYRLSCFQCLREEIFVVNRRNLENRLVAYGQRRYVTNWFPSKPHAGYLRYSESNKGDAKR